jgi:hypothetical protein
MFKAAGRIVDVHWFVFVPDSCTVIGCTGTVVDVVDVDVLVVEVDVEVDVDVVGASVVVDVDVDVDVVGATVVVDVDVDVVGATVVVDVDVGGGTSVVVVVVVPPGIVVVVVVVGLTVVVVVDVEVGATVVVVVVVGPPVVDVVVVGGGASPWNRIGANTWSPAPAVVPKAMTHTTPAASCAGVGGHGYLAASVAPGFPALSVWFATGGPTVVCAGPPMIVKLPDTVPEAGTKARCTGEQPTGMLLPWKRIVGALGSPLHSMIEPSAPTVMPVAV